MEIAEFKALHQLVWSTRHRIQAKWPTPEQDDAYRFAACESGEVLDVVLRQNPLYRRNHVKNPELGHEVAQTAIMLCTGLGEGFDWDNDKIEHSWGYWQESYRTAAGNGYRGQVTDWIASLAADALQEQLWDDVNKVRTEEECYWVGEFCAVQALVACGQVEGVELTEEVEKELQRIEEKFK